MKCDVTDVSQVKAVVQQHPGIKGIVHSAGVLADGTITNLRADAFETVYGPKVLGAQNLHQCTKDIALDFFVLFSSIASKIISCSKDRSIRIWDACTGQVFKTIRAPGGALIALAASCEGDVIVTVSQPRRGPADRGGALLRSDRSGSRWVPAADRVHLLGPYSASLEQHYRGPSAYVGGPPGCGQQRGGVT